MGQSSSKSPEELYSHIVNASISLFRTVGKHWKNENDSKFMNFFADYRHALESGDLAFENDLHVKHAGVENSRLDFIHYILNRLKQNADAFNSASGKESYETLKQQYDEFAKVKNKVKPELVRSHLIASWILHDDNCNGEVQLQTLREQVIDKMEISDKYKESIFYKLRNVPKPGVPKSKGVPATNEDLIPYPAIAEIFDQLGIWKELDVYWRMNFSNDKEARVKGNFLTPFEFGKFLKNHQREAGNVQENLRHSEEISTAFGGTMDRHSFIKFLSDPELNPVIDFKKFNSVYHDMKSHPLPNYFIAASFKTYLAGSGPALSSLCSVDRYRQVLTGEGGFSSEDSSFSPTTLAKNNNTASFGKSQSNAFPLASFPGNNNSETGLDDPNSNSSTYHSCARFVEIDVWGNNVHAIKETVSLGAGTTSREAKFVVGPDSNCPHNIALSQVLTTIRDSAFVKSPYPVIINVQFTNMSQEDQKELAVQLKKGLGGEQRIFCPDTSEDNPLIDPNQWTPDALKGMFILAGRPRPSAAAAAAANASASKQPMIGNQTSKRSIENTLAGNHTAHHTPNSPTSALGGGKTQDDLIGVHPDLHSIFFLHHFVNSNPIAIVGNEFDREHEAPKNFQNDAMSRCALRSLAEDVAAGYSVTHPKSVAQVSWSNFIRIFPARDKWKSTQNFMSPHPSWESGAQIVSMYWQNDPHGDEAIRLYRSRFADNGKVGMLLRPDALLKAKLPKEFFPKNATSSSVPSSPTGKALHSLSSGYPNHQKFSLSILSAFCLPQPRSRLYENEKVNPFVVVKLEGPGHPPNRVLLRTETARDNSFHPSWVNTLPEKTSLEQLKANLEKKGNVDVEIVGNSKDDWNHHQTLKKNNASNQSLDSHQSGSTVGTPRKSSQHHQQGKEVEHYEPKHDEYPPHCSTDIEVFIPEMSQLVIQVYHDRKGVIDRMHDPNSADAMQIENRTEQHAELDDYQLQSRGQLHDVLLAEAILPVHLLNRGVRCARMRCLETGSVSTLLMLKIGELHGENHNKKTSNSAPSSSASAPAPAAEAGGGLRSELSMLLSGGDDQQQQHAPMDLTREFSL